MKTCLWLRYSAYIRPLKHCHLQSPRAGGASEKISIDPL
jgi:hypothetical protein